jgi:RNA ligase partner protein
MSQPEPTRIVLDTSVFTNPDTARQWGATTQEAFATFLKCAWRNANRLQFYMPVSIFEELQSFLGDDALPSEFELVVTLRSPNRYGQLVPGTLLYDLIEDIRRRIDRGLRVAEQAVREVQPASVERSITRLRDQYRSVLRTGLIDSKEDVDVVLLAIELGAAVVSSDGGLVTWADKMGLRLIQPQHLRAIVEGPLTGQCEAGRVEPGAAARTTGST